MNRPKADFFGDKAVSERTKIVFLMSIWYVMLSCNSLYARRRCLNSAHFAGSFWSASGSGYFIHDCNSAKYDCGNLLYNVIPE